MASWVQTFAASLLHLCSGSFTCLLLQYLTAWCYSKEHCEEERMLRRNQAALDAASATATPRHILWVIWKPIGFINQWGEPDQLCPSPAEQKPDDWVVFYSTESVGSSQWKAGGRGGEHNHYRGFPHGDYTSYLDIHVRQSAQDALPPQIHWLCIYLPGAAKVIWGSPSLGASVCDVARRVSFPPKVYSSSESWALT